MDHAFEPAIKIASGKHDLVAIQVYDKRETELPPIGMMEAFDTETGSRVWVDTTSKKVRDTYNNWWKNHSKIIDGIFKRSGTDTVGIITGQDYIKPLMKLFTLREMRQ